MFETIRYDVANGIATITLNRPDRLNAFNSVMAGELVAAFDKTDADDDVRVVIVTGEGRGFCAGADLEAGADTFNYAVRDGGGPVSADGTIDWSHPDVRDTGGKVTLRIFESLKPVIAAINGPAVGIGITMTLAMDFRLIADTAKIGFVFARRGIVTEAASSFFLPRVVGIQTALEWCMTGRVMPAAEAHAGGLTRSLLAPADLLPAATALAREIADNTAAVSVALTRQMLWRGLGMAHPMEAHRIDSRGVYARGRSADAVEGVTSFLEKRPAVYADKVSTGMPGYFPWWSEPEWK
ncbi:crotonase/enoyl-CoA hydratase family protein [Sphingomonas immobilis]|uniref:Crotonase/enoyl-CoA hydratase family protein n=1 Tax=Sphingomonas immobilis TaxID=3063997 RepID=A0ABT8ZYS2_9SPHN|nr:crotonase/enoyl-CoA hydratase family protein [Sphingomonas sp. CA1-15]MDO7842269.1 crotonase/enoyl-CoA hydratase family protein [Sphingomonas sp. CA1-15]